MFPSLVQRESQTFSQTVIARIQSILLDTHRYSERYRWHIRNSTSHQHIFDIVGMLKSAKAYLRNVDFPLKRAKVQKKRKQYHYIRIELAQTVSLPKNLLLKHHNYNSFPDSLNKPSVTSTAPHLSNKCSNYLN